MVSIGMVQSSGFRFFRGLDVFSRDVLVTKVCISVSIIPTCDACRTSMNTTIGTSYVGLESGTSFRVKGLGPSTLHPEPTQKPKP